MEKEVQLTDKLIIGFLAMMLKDRGGSFTISSHDPLLQMSDGVFKVIVIQGKSVKLQLVENIK